MKIIRFALFLLASTTLSSFFWFLIKQDKYLTLTHVETASDIYEALLIWSIVLSFVVFYPLYQFSLYLERRHISKTVQILLCVGYTVVIGFFTSTFFHLSQII